MKKIIGVCFAMFATAAAHGIAVDDARRQTIDFTCTANPIVPEGMFFCDPAARVAPDGTLWIAVSAQDERGADNVRCGRHDRTGGDDV